MATASSTRPPTFGEASSASQGEGAGEGSIADVADWGHALQGERPEEVAPAPALPVMEAGILSQEVGTPVEPAPPLAAPLPDAHVAPKVAVSPVEPSGAVAVEPPARQPGPAVLAPPGEAFDPEETFDPDETLDPLPPAESPGTSVIADPAQITAHPSSQPLPGTKTPPPETPLPVLLLVDQARSASGEERQELSRRINRWLDQMVREGGSRHVADWFHHLIESGRLEGLADAAGHACHETAIRGLLAMGFPYALEIRPEDLDRIKPRGEGRRQAGEAGVKGASAGVLTGGIVVELVLNLLRGRSITGLLTIEVGVAVLSLLALLLSTPRTPLRNMGLAVLLVLSLLSVSLGVLTGYAGLVSGLAGLVAVLLFALHRS